MVKVLGQQGCSVTTLVDLSSGHRDAVLCGEFVQGIFGDRAVLDTLLSRGFDAVMHFASFIQVGESAQQPDKYYSNNASDTQGLLDAMREHGRTKLMVEHALADYDRAYGFKSVCLRYFNAAGGVSALGIGQHSASPMNPGDNHKKDDLPGLFPGFGPTVNVALCTSLHCK